MNLLKSFGGEKLPSVINDPFQKTNITSIHVWYSRSLWHPYPMEASGKVEFKNGNTTGEQRFDGKTFDDVVIKIKAMIENLEQ